MALAAQPHGVRGRLRFRGEAGVAWLSSILGSRLKRPVEKYLTIEQVYVCVSEYGVGKRDLPPLFVISPLNA